MYGAIHVRQATIEVTPPGEPKETQKRTPERRMISVRLAMLLFLMTAILFFSSGYWIWTRPIICDGTKISVSKNGKVHREGCPHYKKGKHLDCEICGGLSGK